MKDLNELRYEIEIRVKIPSPGIVKGPSELVDSFVVMSCIPRVDDILIIENDDLNCVIKVIAIMYDDIGKNDDHSHGIIVVGEYLSEIIPGVE